MRHVLGSKTFIFIECDLRIYRAGDEYSIVAFRRATAAARAHKAGKAETQPIIERDIPIGSVGLVTLACMLPAFVTPDERNFLISRTIAIMMERQTSMRRGNRALDW
jgi:hypothetical protein